MAGSSEVRVGVLGPTTLTSGGSPVSLSPVQRRLLAALVMTARDGSSPEWLVDHVWSDDPPATARQSLHNHLARLRRQLPPPVITWDGRRYQLDGTQAVLDVEAFEQACARAVEAAAAGDPARVRRLSEDALRLWRGEPYDDLAGDDTTVETERFRVSEIHADIEELHAQVLLDLNELSLAVSRLQAMVRAKPEREERWRQLMLALARSGRRSDALQAYREAEVFFTQELDLRPPEALTRLQRRILVEELPAEVLDPLLAAPMVGRDALLEDLAALLGRTQAVVLTGEAGIGKSTVMQALADRRDEADLRTVRVTCLTNPWSALQPVVDLLQNLAPDLARLQPPPGRAVLHLLGARAQPGDGDRPSSSDPGMLTRDVADALARVAEQTAGLTVLLDDAHRGGPTSHRLLLAALDRSPQLKLVVATRQQESLPQALIDRAHVTAITPLEPAATRTLAARLLDSDEGLDELTGWLHELTGGNPLFATAVLNDLRRQGSLQRDDTTGVVRPPTDIVVPPRLSEIIETSIASLALASRRVLDVAAVLDDPVDEELLLEFTEPAALERSLGAGILLRISPTSLRFRHELVRRVTYDLVPTGRRVELHHAVATLLRERGMAAPRVASHALEAVDLDPIGASQAARSAGEAALEAMTFEEAARWFDRAAAAAAAAGMGRTQTLALEVEAADARRLAGLPAHAEALLDLAEEAVRLDDDTLRRRAVLAALELGETGEVGPLQRRAADLAARALDQEHDPAARATISAAASMVHSLSGEPQRCRQLFVEALAGLDDDDPATAARVLPYAYMGLAHVDDLAERASAAKRLRRDAAAAGDPVAQFEGWHLTFSVALQQADGTLARDAHEAMRGLLDRVGDAGRRWQFTYQEAALAHLDGRLDDAERFTDEALQIGSGVAPGRALGAYSGQLVELRRAAGRLAELAPLMADLVEQQDTLPAWRAVASFVLAEIDAERSRELFDDLATDGFAALPPDFAWLAAVHVLARGAVLRRDVGQAAYAAEVLEPYRELGCWQGTCSYGPIAVVLAQSALLQGDRERAAALAEVAVTRAASLRAPAYVAEAHEVLAAARD